MFNQDSFFCSFLFLNSFITNFYTFNSFLKNFNKPNTNSDTNGDSEHVNVKSNYFNYVLCKSLVKYQKKAKNVFSIRNLKPIKQIEFSNNKENVDLNNNCSKLNVSKDSSDISNQKDTKKSSMRRRDFIMRLIDFNFFVLF